MYMCPFGFLIDSQMQETALLHYRPMILNIHRSAERAKNNTYIFLCKSADLRGSVMHSEDHIGVVLLHILLAYDTLYYRLVSIPAYKPF